MREELLRRRERAGRARGDRAPTKRGQEMGAFGNAGMLTVLRAAARGGVDAGEPIGAGGPDRSRTD